MLFLWLNKSPPEKVLLLAVKRVFVDVFFLKSFQKIGWWCDPFALAYNFSPFGIKRKKQRKLEAFYNKDMNVNT
jgi:hypothetical protein